jgi:ubiquinone/menaquinone biosynthesis C-methylase UbiE
MALQVLERVVPAPLDCPERAPEEYLPMQDLTRRIALDGEWSPEVAERMRQLFDGLAPEWHLLASEARLDVTRDALARGGIPAGGTCLEIGSGTGIHTPVLAGHFSSVVSLDFAAEMISRAPRDLSALVRGDASSLPLRDGHVDAVVCVNAFLFPAEYARVLRPDGAVAFVSTSGDRTPIYLPAADVLAAMPGDWAGVTSEAAAGTWTVLRRG